MKPRNSERLIAIWIRSICLDKKYDMSVIKSDIAALFMIQTL